MREALCSAIMTGHEATSITSHGTSSVAMSGFAYAQFLSPFMSIGLSVAMNKLIWNFSGSIDFQTSQFVWSHVLSVGYPTGSVHVWRPAMIPIAWIPFFFGFYGGVSDSAGFNYKKQSCGCPFHSVWDVLMVNSQKTHVSRQFCARSTLTCWQEQLPPPPPWYMT